jgi:hypothetical protein
MIRTLRITGILAVALAGILVVFSIIFGGRSDASVVKLLDEPSIIEKFNESTGNKASRGENEVSPLVKQAGSFALYLNPPRPPVRRPTMSRSGVVKRPPAATPKFKVLATSYYKNHPEMSIALIDEPGKGLNWVRQSGKVGHLFIEQIKDGIVVVKDGNGTFELAAEEKPHVSLLAGATSVGSKGTAVPGKTEKVDKKPSTKPPVKSPVYSNRAVSRAKKLPKAPQQIKAKQKESAMDELSYRLTQLKKVFESDEKYTEQEKLSMYNELISDFRASQASRLSDEDLKNLDNTTETIKKMMEKPAKSGQK